MPDIIEVIIEAEQLVKYRQEVKMSKEDYKKIKGKNPFDYSQEEKDMVGEYLNLHDVYDWDALDIENVKPSIGETT